MLVFILHGTMLQFLYIFAASGQKEFSNNMIDKLYSTFDFECAAKELFLWAVLLNRRELALIFWKNGKDHIGKKN